MLFTEMEKGILREEIKSFIKSPPEKLESLFYSIFCNYLLRFVVVNGKTYPAYIQIFIGYQRLIKIGYTNPHQRNVRLGYNSKKKKLFIEEVSHPFLTNQRVAKNTRRRIILSNKQQIDYTKLRRRFPRWKKTRQEFFLEQIISVEIRSFVDKSPFTEDDIYAYKLIIQTKDVH